MWNGQGASGPSQRCDHCGSLNLGIFPSAASIPYPVPSGKTFHCGNCHKETLIDPNRWS